MNSTRYEAERKNAREWQSLTTNEKAEIERTCSVRLWGDAKPDSLFTKNRRGEWCRIAA